MKKGIGSLAIAAVLTALCAIPAQASTRITSVTNDSSATNGCTVRSVYGYGGYNFNAIVWGVTCPGRSEIYVERVDHWESWGYTYCEMRNPSSGYFVTGGCGYYSLYSN